MIPLNEVQEEDQRNMTTDEYKVSFYFRCGWMIKKQNLLIPILK